MIQAPDGDVHRVQPLASRRLLEGSAWRAVVVLASTGSAVVAADGIRRALPDGGWLLTALAGATMAVGGLAALVAVGASLRWAFRVVGVAADEPFVPAEAPAALQATGSRLVRSRAATTGAALATGALIALLAVGIGGDGDDGSDRVAGSETDRGGSWSASAISSDDPSGTSSDSRERAGDYGMWDLRWADPPPPAHGGDEQVVPGDGDESTGDDESGSDDGSDDGHRSDGGDDDGDGDDGDDADASLVEETCETVDETEDTLAGDLDGDGTLDETSDDACDTLEGAEDDVDETVDDVDETVDDVDETVDDDDSLVGDVLEGLLGDDSSSDSTSTTTSSTTTSTTTTTLLPSELL